MQFNLYVTTSERNALSKGLIDEFACDGNILGESSVVNPTFLIQGENLSQYNYMYVPDFGRYYFISDITVVRTDLWCVSCSVDVLMTYRKYIVDLSVIVDKQENQFMSNRFINDGSFIADQRVGIEMFEFPSGFLKEAQFVLTTLGPGGTISGN